MKRFVVALCAAFALCGCTVSYQPSTASTLPTPTAGTASQQAAALAAAREYLAMIDGERFDALWERSGPALKASTSRFMWINTLKVMHGALGAVGDRQVQGFGFSTRIDASVPVGDYVLVQFASRSGKVTATEKVVMQNDGGVWKIIGYFINRHAQIGDKAG